MPANSFPGKVRAALALLAACGALAAGARGQAASPAADNFYDMLEHDPAALQAAIRQRVQGIVGQAQELNLRVESAERVLRALPESDLDSVRRQHAELKQVREEYSKLMRSMPPAGDRQRLAVRLAELREDIHTLRRSGHGADAEKLQRDALEVMAAMVGLHPMRGPKHKAPVSGTHADLPPSPPPKPSPPAADSRHEPTTAELRGEIGRLRAEVDALRTQLNQQRGPDGAKP